jgi:hypothetical protein
LLTTLAVVALLVGIAALLNDAPEPARISGQDTLSGALPLKIDDDLAGFSASLSAVEAARRHATEQVR